MKILAPFVLALVAAFGIPAAATLPGAAISGAGGTGAGISPTPQSITTATVLSGTVDITAFITASFSGSITLPAATTAGQTVTIIDKAGVCSGDANGSTENMIALVVSNTGTESITAPGLAGSLTQMLCWKNYAAITLVSDGTSKWVGRHRMYWHVDPRTIGGLEALYDARRGITLNSSTVSTWADVSGAASPVDLTQGTAGAQPTYVYTTSSDPNVTAPENFVSFSSAVTADSLQSSVTPAFTSDSITLFGSYSRYWTESGTVNEVLIASVETTTLGFSWFVRMNGSVGSAVANDWYIRGSGTNNGDPTRAGPKHWNYSWHRVNETALLGAAPQRSIVRFDTQFNASAAGNQLAVPDFTQALVMGNSTLNARVHMVAVYDAALTITEILNMELAMQEVWPQF